MTARLLAPLAVVLLAVAGAGCSTISETASRLNPFSSAATKSKAVELVPFQASAELRVVWQAAAGAAADYVFTPAVVGDSVFAAAANGSVTRYDQGRQVWRGETGQPLSGGVGSDGRVVVVGTPKGEVLAFDGASGKALWSAKVSSEVLAAPAVADGLVVVRSGDSRIFGFDAADGKRRWVYQRSTPPLSLRSHVGVLLSDRVVVAGFPGGKLVAINTQNGAALWEVAVALPKGATELERIADISSLPVVEGGQICAAAYQGRVACFDLGNGTMLWSREVSTSAGIDMDQRHVYVTDDKGTIHAFDRQGGASVWKQDRLGYRGVSRPLAVGTQVAVADGQGYVHLLRREDGAFAARLATDGSAVLADPQKLGAGFLVQTQRGGLFALAKD